MPRIALTRTIQICNPLQLEKSQYASIDDLERIRTFITSRPKPNGVDDTAVAKFLEAYDEQITRAESSVHEKDVDKLLRLIPGKELLRELTQELGLRSPSAVLNSARTHLVVADYPHLVGLGDKFSELLREG